MSWGEKTCKHFGTCKMGPTIFTCNKTCLEYEAKAMNLHLSQTNEELLRDLTTCINGHLGEVAGKDLVEAVAHRVLTTQPHWVPWDENKVPKDGTRINVRNQGRDIATIY